jgi:SAM-dependent methyltransferase
VLDAGTGSGRHARQAALYGAQVAAIDLGDSIDVARRNVPDDVLTIQTDLEALPFEPRTFDLVMSIGVLHHLPDTQAALSYLTSFARPGGRVRVYLYWQPPRPWHRAVLKLIDAARLVTTRLPHRVLKVLCYPLSALLWLTVVLPHRYLGGTSIVGRLVAQLPLMTYADYPFGVLVNDQFDRFSAPIERRFRRAEVEEIMQEAGLVEVTVYPNAGWVAEGIAP